MDLTGYEDCPVRSMLLAVAETASRTALQRATRACEDSSSVHDVAQRDAAQAIVAKTARVINVRDREQAETVASALLQRRM